MSNFDPWAGYMQGQQSLGGSLAGIAQMEQQKRQMNLAGQRESRMNKLSDLQTMGQEAQNNALVSQYGTGDRPTPLAQLSDAMMFQNEEKKMVEEEGRRTQTVQRYLSTVDNLKKAGASPQFITEYTKTEMGNDPRYKALAPFVSFADGDVLEITKDYKDGEITDPISGQPLPAGKYAVKGKRTGDPAAPFAFHSIAPVKTEKAVERTVDLGDRVEYIYTDGTRQTQRKGASPGGTGGSGGGMPKGKPPIGYRYTATGDLEAIPGGPAAIKAEDRNLATEGKEASIDITLRSIDDLLSHPGRAAATGLSGIANRVAIPGTDRKGFLSKLDTLKAQTFIPQVAALKGMGALSDAEGKKLTDAVGALDPMMGEQEFEQSLRTIKADLERARGRIPVMRQNDGRNPPAPAGAKPQNPQSSGIPAEAISYLRKNPALKSQFDQKYGKGASDRVLRGK